MEGGAAVNFLELQDAVIAERFDESQRGDVKDWINVRYGWILALEDWTFLYGTDLVNVTAGSNAVAGLPIDFGIVRAFNRADGVPLIYLAPKDFMDTYYGQTSTGLPVHYTIIGSSVQVGPISSETSSTYQLVYEKEGTALSADGDVPVIPKLFHMVLVFGGAATGLKLQSDPTWRDHDQDFTSAITAMRRRYLVPQRGDRRMLGRDPLTVYT